MLITRWVISFAEVRLIAECTGSTACNEFASSSALPKSWLSQANLTECCALPRAGGYYEMKKHACRRQLSGVVCTAKARFPAHSNIGAYGHSKGRISYGTISEAGAIREPSPSKLTSSGSTGKRVSKRAGIARPTKLDFTESISTPSK